MRFGPALLAALIAVGGCSAQDAEPPALIGDWEMVGGTLDGAPFPLVDGYRITVSFADDGSMGGVAACNSYGGTYVADSEDVIFGDDTASTAMGCPAPGVMESEQAFFSALRSSPSLSYVRAGQSLTLEGSDVVLEFAAVAPVPSAELIGSEWSLETLVDGDVARSVTGDATLLLAADGSLEGSTGCRSLAGSYIVEGDTVLFTEFSASGDCPSDLADQDGFVITVLGDGFTAEIDGDLLTITSQGREGLVYRRSG